MEQTEIKNINRTAFWTLPRFLIANAIVALLIFFGLRVAAIAALRFTVSGFYISSVLVWYLAVSIVWWIVVAGYTVQLLQRHALYKKYPLGVVIGAWILALLPAWYVFLGGLRLYVTVHQSGLL